MNRRDFLKAGMTSALSMVALPALSMGLKLPTHYANEAQSNNFWDRDRTLRLYRPSTGERGNYCYWRNGKIDQDGYQKICHLMRDVQANKSKSMDINLLNMLRGLTGWLELSYGITTPFEVTSGYRSPETNEKLEGAAKNSMHLQGKAIDGRMKGIPPEYLGRLFASFQTGGVGFYINRERGFVHVDTGRVRYWVK